MRWIYGQSSAQSHERAAELVLEPDQAVCSMLVLDLLGRVRQVGPAQAERMLACADVAADVHGRRADCEAACRARGGAAAARRSALSPRPSKGSAMTVQGSCELHQPRAPSGGARRRVRPMAPRLRITSGGRR